MKCETKSSIWVNNFQQMIGIFSQTSIRSVKLKLWSGQCGYSVSVVIGVYYLGSIAEAAERVTPSGALPEPVLEPTATVRWSACAWVPPAVACRSAWNLGGGSPEGWSGEGCERKRWTGLAVAGECRDPWYMGCVWAACLGCKASGLGWNLTVGSNSLTKPRFVPLKKKLNHSLCSSVAQHIFFNYLCNPIFVHKYQQKNIIKNS